MLKKSNQKGFTIIEVLIVLAIAGLIMLIIFLAVPALQRNSRNNAMRSGVNSVLGMVNEYVANNNGTLPVGIFGNKTTGNVCMSSAALTACAASDATLMGQIPTGIDVTASTTGGVVSATDALNEILVAPNTKCTSMTAVSGQNRSVAAMFRVETAGSTTGTLQCQDS